MYCHDGGWRGVWALVVAVSLAGCGNGAADGLVAAPEWQLSPEPTLVIGEDGTPEGEFHRISTVLALPGDEIAVVDNGHREIRVFATTGAHLRSIGRPGEGPGEFSSIGWAEVDHDTLVVYDVGQRRATMFGLDGTVHTTVLLRHEGGTGFIFCRARAADGRWVITTPLAAARLVDQNAPPPSGVLRDTIGVGFLPATGAGSVEIAMRTPSHSAITVPGQNMVMRGRFAADLQVLRVGRRIVVANPDSATLHLFDEGRLEERRATLGVPRRPLVAAEVDRLREQALEQSGSPRGRLAIEASYSREALPAHLPVFASALPDGADQLWLEEWTQDNAAPARYLVVGLEGSWRASVAMPPRFKLTAVGPDWVLGVHRDADDVQRVMRYGLTRR